MNNHLSRYVNDVQEGDESTNAVNMSQEIKLNSVSHDEEIVRLTLKAEYQNGMIDELSSKMIRIEGK